MTSSLRWLYERYRTASPAALVAPKRKPGEWLEVHPKTPEAKFLQETSGIDTSSGTGLAAAVEYLGGMRLNQLLGVTYDDDIRITHFRNGKSKHLYVRFFAAQPGKKQGTPGFLRSSLPISHAQMELNLGATAPESVSFEGGVRQPDLPPNEPDGRLLENSHESADQPNPEPTPKIDYASVFDVEDFERFLASGDAEKDNDLARFIAESIEEARAVVETQDDVDPLEIINALTEKLGAPTAHSPMLDLEAPDPVEWHTASRQVVESTLTLCQKYRNEKGKLAILCPSPSGGKTHGMVEAARADRAAGKRVGYAVLARGKLMEEAKERLTGGDKHLVQLHIIEGRHAGNCVEYESVEQAAALGYSPGTHVCPKCDKYPNLSNPFSSLDRNATCEYYASRLRALRDIRIAKEYNNPLIRPYPVILTTHASLAIGVSRGASTFRKLPSLWDMNTIFIDEDPTGALEQLYVIKEHQLVYEWRDQVTNRPDAHTQMTRVLRGMFTLARAERHLAWTNGYKDSIHTRDHGSTYASNDLIGLLSRAAKTLGYDLEEVLAQVENESDVKSPKRGELLSVKAEIAAERYPHRYLSTLSQAIRHEILTRKNAPGQGSGLDLAYRVHMDLTLVPDHDPMTEGETDGAITLAITNPFATNDANIIIGDAYASIEHYENLFRRFRRHGDVDIVNHRVKWPQSSLLIRVPTRCGSGDFPTDASYLEHCDKALLPLLSMEQGRRVLLYTHKGSRELLDEWLKKKAGQLDLETYAIEHWGSGRGKDIYRDFDTFIAASEYLPNIYGLVHEANSRVAQSNALTPRIYFWNAGMRRESGGSLTDAITSTAPALSDAFQRRAVDELAQAIHRIRPAKPRPCEACGKLLGRDPRRCEDCGTPQPPARWQKRCWVLGYHVPMSMELLAATCTTKIEKERQIRIVREGRDHRGRGAQVKVHADLGLLGFLSDREVATAIGDVYRDVGCWSPAFTHTLEGVPLSAAVSRAFDEVVFGETEGEPVQPFSDPTGMGSGRFGAALPIVPLTGGSWSGESSRLVDRVYSPPAAWQSIADRITTLPMYRAGLNLFFDEAASRRGRPLQRFHVRRDWMPKGSHGLLCFGDPRRLEAIIEYYGPNPPPVPF